MYMVYVASKKPVEKPTKAAMSYFDSADIRDENWKFRGFTNEEIKNSSHTV